MTLTTALTRGMADKVIMSFPQPGLDIGSPGAPVINGAGQLGTTLTARGFANGYAIKVGQYFSIVHNGVRYLHQVMSATNANGAGQATLLIHPMLRAATLDGTTLEFADPKIEGWLQNSGKQGWTISLVHSVGCEFVILEAE